MGDEEDNLKNLLKAAEVEITGLREQNADQSNQINQLIVAQEIQGAEVMELVDKVWELTEALQHTQDQSVEAQMIASVLSDKLTRLRTQMDDVLRAAKENASRVQLVSTIYQMTDQNELSEEEEVMAEYGRRMQELRDRLGAKSKTVSDVQE